MALQWPTGYGYKHFDEIDSTNAEARRSSNTSVTPLWISADQQSAGKGRRGREWVSAGVKDDAMLATLLLRPNCTPMEASELSFVAALAVADVLLHFCNGNDVKLKWPNDVLLDNKKASGILLESASSSTNEIDWLAIGIGINLRTHPETDGWPATHIDEYVKAPTSEDTLIALAHYWNEWYQCWQKSGFGVIRQRWLRDAVGLGSEITARLPNIEYKGVFEDIDEAGTLILRTKNGVQKIAAADVYF